MNELKVRGLGVAYSALDPRLGTDRVIADASFSVAGGEIFGVVGPTGCGKSVLLRTLVGLIKPFEGEILKDGVDITAKKPHDRGMSMVFQEYALYPHLTSRGNIRFPLLNRKRYRAHPDARVDEIARAFHIDRDDLLSRRPRNISGGEKQRVAIGKAIAVLPDILLLDEPLSNIEENMRVEFRKNLRGLARDNGIAVVYVTHNQTEIAEIADRVAVMYQGRFEQTGTFIDLYNDPKRYFVSLFVGEKTTNFLTADEVSEATNGKIAYSLTIRPNECRIANADSDAAKSIVLRGETAMIENFVSEKRKIAFLELPRGGYDNLFGVEIPIDYEIDKGAHLAIEVPFGAAKFFDESGDRIFNLW